MADFTQQHFAQLVQTAKQNAETLAQGLELCFGQPCQIEEGLVSTLPEEVERGDLFNAGGLVVGMRAGNGGLVALIPESLPLPDWYQEPDGTEISRLQTLAKDWSTCLFPEELRVDEQTTFACSSLNEAINNLAPVENAEWLPLSVTLEGADSAQVLYLLGAVQSPCLQLTTEPVTPTAPQTDETANEVEGSSDFTLEERQQRANRVRHLPVNVTVRLVDKKIELSQLRTLSPGSLIMFDKNCEELLDLYVNNSPYCRGEVVKVGENFGLKVDEVGYYVEREAKII